MQGAEHLGVRRQPARWSRRCSGRRRASHSALALAAVVAPGARRLPVAERGVERRERRPRVGDQRQRAMLGGVERLHVEADETAGGVLEQRPGAGGEIGEAGADGEDHVGLRGERVGRAGAGDADRAQRQRMVGRRRRFAGLRLGDRNPVLLAEGDQLALGVRIEHAAAANDERLLGRARRSAGRLLEFVRVGRAGGAGDARARRRSSPDSRRPRSARPGRRRASPARIRPGRSAPRPRGSAPARSARAA